MSVEKGFRMDIRQAIDECQEFFHNPPQNEANTSAWVILPLLYASGYARRDVVAESADNGGKFPDYTLLPNDPEHKFYLEAKAWKINLEDSHSNQALNYANQNGKRWVLLSNGRTWRLYDNDIRGLAADKLVAEMTLDNKEEALRFLAAIEKGSVCENRLPEFASAETDKRKVEAQKKQLLATEAAPSEQRRTQQTSLPTSTKEVLVVPARKAWLAYRTISAYICQPKRHFRETSHIAFYAEGRIQERVPRIVDVIDEVEMSPEGIDALGGISEETRTCLKRIVEGMQNYFSIFGKKQKIMVLSDYDSPETIRLQHPVVNDCKNEAGRSIGFARGQRYVPLSRLMDNPKTTTELCP
jgi:predicted type IV restriction endonuclease